MKKKIALITGVTGQDGAYLADFLLNKNYIVHGIKRRSSSFNTNRIDHLIENPREKKNKFFLYHGDMTDSFSIINLVNKIKPDEIYNLAAQSHVAVSFEKPEYTANSDALGTLRILESIKSLGLEKKTKFYQASTSEMYGLVKTKKQNEKTPFYPRSPYGVAKLYAHWITVNYREAYGIFACSGILFNHESPLRGETFVSKKIINGLVAIKNKKLNHIYLGNIYAKRDWGHAKDYVVAMWKMLQQKKAEDFVIATGESFSVKQFINISCKLLSMKVKWQGSGLNETLKFQGRSVIKIDPRLFRPSEVDYLCGDYSKAKNKLKWKPETNLETLIKDMIKEELTKY